MDSNQNGETLNAVMWVLGSLATITFLLRMYTRFILIRQPGWDDYTMIFCWSLALTSAILVSVAVHYGLGMNITDIKDPQDRMNAVKYLTLAPNFNILSVGIGKTSIVFFLIRLLSGTESTSRKIVLWVIVLISNMLNIAGVSTVLGFCTPTESIWNPDVPGTCIDPQVQLGIGMAQVCYNAVTDFFLALFPVVIFWNLNVKLRRKIGLLMILGAGVFGAAVTSYKAYSMMNLSSRDNITISWYRISIWNGAEMWVLITTANMPTLRPLFSTYFRGSSYGAETYPLGSGNKATAQYPAPYSAPYPVMGKAGSFRGDDSSVDRMLPSEESQVGQRRTVKTLRYAVETGSYLGDKSFK